MMRHLLFRVPKKGQTLTHHVQVARLSENRLLAAFVDGPSRHGTASDLGQGGCHGPFFCNAFCLGSSQRLQSSPCRTTFRTTGASRWDSNRPGTMFFLCLFVLSLYFHTHETFDGDSWKKDSPNSFSSKFGGRGGAHSKPVTKKRNDREENRPGQQR